jgi:hypothetical protein
MKRLLFVVIRNVCWQLNDKTNKHKRMLHCRFNSCNVFTNWICEETVLQFQRSRWTTFPGTYSQCFIVCAMSSSERRFELSICGQFNTKTDSSQQFWLTSRTVPFCDYSKIQAKYMLNIALHFVTTARYTQYTLNIALYFVTTVRYTHSTRYILHCILWLETGTHTVHAKYCTTFCDYSQVHT